MRYNFLCKHIKNDNFFTKTSKNIILVEGKYPIKCFFNYSKCVWSIGPHICDPNTPKKKTRKFPFPSHSFIQ